MSCKQDFPLFNYVGLHPDSRMGSHWCDEVRELFINHPRIRNIHDKIREVPVGTYKR